MKGQNFLIVDELTKKNLSDLEIENFERLGYWTETDPIIEGLSSNSKNIKPGYIFFAVDGFSHHGANFVLEAIDKGAILVITDCVGAKIVTKKSLDIALMIVNNPRKKLAEYAARLNACQPKIQVAVTGTNGKTSVCHFVRQLWELLGYRAASIGTLGVQGEINISLDSTTPDPVTLHKILNELVQKQVEYVAMEASSHGLDQFRLDGVSLTAAAYTNLSRDHLDYHSTEDDYLVSKCMLFDRVLTHEKIVVLNVDDSYAQVIKLVSENRGHKVVKVGSDKTADIKICSQRFNSNGQILKFLFQSSSETVELPLIGAFQASNVLIAAALVIASGAPPERVFENLPKLQTVPGRMELVGTKKTLGNIYIDYAHTPEALRSALKALKLHTIGRLIVVFGAGGERDSGKRPLMGQIANDYADKVFVTDDNPRNESPTKIRSEILSECPNAIEIPDRATAILTAINDVVQGDVLLIAGKGHETGQIVGDDILPFNDSEFVSMSLALLEGKKT